VGSLAACKGIPNEANKYSAEGTAYHEIAATALSSDPAGTNSNCAAYVGHKVHADGFDFIIDEQNAEYAQVYVENVRRIPGDLMVEVKLDTSRILGVPGQGGTGDAVILDYESKTIHVHDLKFGMRRVTAAGNEQLIEYAAAALDMFDMLADWEYIKVAIDQPRIRHYDTHTYSVAEIRDWLTVNAPLEQEAFRLYERGTPDEIRAAMKPSPKACEWCPLRGKCPAQTAGLAAAFSTSPATAATVGKLTDEQLALERIKVEEYEAYVSAIKQEAHARAMAGAHLPGWKLVEGKQGNRAWADPTKTTTLLDMALGNEAELLSALGESEAYKPREILSPADTEKALGKKRHPEAEKRLKAWADIQAHITRAPAGKSLVREDTPGQPVTIKRMEFSVTP
jgi:hypothetical protein